MRAREFIQEQPQPQPGIDAEQSGLDQALQQDPAQPKTPPPNTQQIATALKKLAGGQPVGPTGNVGIDNLLFKTAGLRKKVGVVGNTIGRGLNAIGGAFAGATSIQRTQFSGPRSGADIARGVAAKDTKPVSTGQQVSTGIKSIPSLKNELSNDQMADLFVKAAAGQPVSQPTNNANIDYLLQKAGLLEK